MLNQVSEILSRIDGVVVAGGAARYDIMAAGEAPYPGDIDVFVLKGTEVSMVDMALRGLGYRQYHAPSPHTTTYKRNNYDDLNVQVVANDGNAGREWNSAEDVIATFGWTTEQFAIYRDGDGMFVEIEGESAFDDTKARVLHVNHVIDPVRLAYRAVKYGRKGYSITPAEMLKVFEVYENADPDKVTFWRGINASNQGY